MIHFLAASIPSQMPEGICIVMNWAARNNFEVNGIANGFIIRGNNIAIPAYKRQGEAIPVIHLYVRCTPSAFRDYFGSEYEEKDLQKIPLKIAEKEGFKKEVVS